MPKLARSYPPRRVAWMFAVALLTSVVIGKLRGTPLTSHGLLDYVLIAVGATLGMMLPDIPGVSSAGMKIGASLRKYRRRDAES